MRKLDFVALRFGEHITHPYNIKQKLKSNNWVEMMLQALRHGLIQIAE